MDDLCGNITVSINQTLSLSWAALGQDGIHQFLGSSSSYLRPDAQALTPWVYTAIFLLAHIPTVVLRVLKWETVQLWCLASTAATVSIYVLAYISTEFAPAKIFVWTPLMLIIDAGSMAQIFFLLNEEAYFLVHLNRRRKAQKAGDDIEMEIKREGDAVISEVERVAEASPGDDIPEAERLVTAHPEDGAVSKDKESAEMQFRWLLLDQRFYIALASLCLFIAIVVLQVLGLKKAVEGSQLEEFPLVRWCSPVFQPFGIAVRDGDCHVYPIDQTFSKGIGCISLPGYQQAQWLKGTVAGTSIALVFEFGDVMILAFVGSSKKPRGVKMRRPWLTMFSGLAVLAIMLIFGILYADNLPPGITSKVWIVLSQDHPVIYAAQLEPAGLRGAIIGWHDGLFASWGKPYFGYSG